MSAAELADDAQVCNGNGVKKAALVATVRSGCTTGQQLLRSWPVEVRPDGDIVITAHS